MLQYGRIPARLCCFIDRDQYEKQRRADPFIILIVFLATLFLASRFIQNDYSITLQSFNIVLLLSPTVHSISSWQCNEWFKCHTTCLSLSHKKSSFMNVVSFLVQEGSLLDLRGTESFLIDLTMHERPLSKNATMNHEWLIMVALFHSFRGCYYRASKNDLATTSKKSKFERKALCFLLFSFSASFFLHQSDLSDCDWNTKPNRDQNMLLTTVHFMPPSRENCFHLRYFALLLYIRHLCFARCLLCFVFSTWVFIHFLFFFFFVFFFFVILTFRLKSRRILLLLLFWWILNISALHWSEKL